MNVRCRNDVLLNSVLYITSGRRNRDTIYLKCRVCLLITFISLCVLRLLSVCYLYYPNPQNLYHT